MKNCGNDESGMKDQDLRRGVIKPWEGSKQESKDLF